MKTTVTCFLPGLLPPFLKQIEAPNPFDALSYLISRATYRRTKLYTVEQNIKAYFHGLPENEMPAGALGALGAGLISPAEKGIWCRADPIECHVDLQTAYILGNAHLQLSTQETKQLIDELNKLLNQEGLVIKAATSQEWYGFIPSQTEITTYPLLDVLRKNMASLFPVGPSQTYWRRLITECQMILMANNVNTQRLKAQQSLVNSLWFWGVGALPSPLHTTFNAIYTSNNIMRGLGQCAKIPVFNLSDNITTLLTNKSPHILLADFQLAVLGKQQLLQDWYALLCHYETQWFIPLLQALKKKIIHKLIINAGEGHEFHLCSRQLNYFWRKPRPLSCFAAMENKYD